MDKKLLLKQDDIIVNGEIVMKRILAILFALQILFCSLGMAFEQPDPNRWFWLGSDDKLGWWIDIQSTDYRISKQYPHQGHKQVDVWVLNYNTEEDTSSIGQYIVDLNCRKSNLSSFVKYDNKGNVIDSWNQTFENYKSIVPGSWGESIFIFCKAAWDSDPRNKNK